MASTVTITEYAAMPNLIGGGGVAQIAGPVIASKTYACTGASAQSDAVSTATVFVRIDNDAGGPMRYLVGDSPVALVANTGAKAGSPRLAADRWEYVGISPGQKVAFISDT